MTRNPLVRKRIYALSAALTPILVILGVQTDHAVAYMGAVLAVANLIMAILNVPGDDLAEQPHEGHE